MSDGFWELVMLLSVKGTWSRGSGKLSTEPAESQGEWSLHCLAPHQVLAYAHVCMRVHVRARVCVHIRGEVVGGLAWGGALTYLSEHQTLNSCFPHVCLCGDWLVMCAVHLTPPPPSSSPSGGHPTILPGTASGSGAPFAVFR